jgi:hypothetical protein
LDTGTGGIAGLAGFDSGHGTFYDVLGCGNVDIPKMERIDLIPLGCPGRGISAYLKSCFSSQSGKSLSQGSHVKILSTD